MKEEMGKGSGEEVGNRNGEEMGELEKVALSEEKLIFRLAKYTISSSLYLF